MRNVKVENTEFEKLIIMGNGFDKQIGLRSDFYSFWSSTKEVNYRENHAIWEWNIWDILIENLERKNLNWSDFEAFIKDFLLNYVEFFKKSKKSLPLKCNWYSLGEYVDPKNGAVSHNYLLTFPLLYLDTDEFDITDEDDMGNDAELNVYKRIVQKYSFEKNLLEHDFDISLLRTDELKEEILFEVENEVFNDHTHNESKIGKLANTGTTYLESGDIATRWDPEHFYSVALAELKLWERRFSDYLHTIMFENRDKYTEQYTQLLESIAGSEEDIQILDFNYTWITKNELKNNFFTQNVGFKHIHGFALKEKMVPEELESSIVTGIDYSELDISDRLTNVMEFSKTFRVLDFDTRFLSKTKKFNIPESNLNLDLNKIKYVVFYGHSLSAADDAYFRTLFDELHLYDGDLCVEFIYSEYQRDQHEIDFITEWKSRINALFLRYTNDSEINRQDKSNLMHKLILENRISIRRIN